jgi:hypothetical protein
MTRDADKSTGTQNASVGANTKSADDRARELVERYCRETQANVPHFVTLPSLIERISALLRDERERALVGAAKELDEMADYSFEGFNMGDMTIQECAMQEAWLRKLARHIRALKSQG